MSKIQTVKSFINEEIKRRGFDENGDIVIDFAGLCEAREVILAASELGYEAYPANGEGNWWIAKSTWNWQVYDAAEFSGHIIGILVNSTTMEAREAIMDKNNYAWDFDFQYPAIGIDSLDIASKLDFDGAKVAGYVFVE